MSSRKHATHNPSVNGCLAAAMDSLIAAKAVANRSSNGLGAAEIGIALNLISSVMNTITAAELAIRKASK